MNQRPSESSAEPDQQMLRLPLTCRELEVLDLVQIGLTNRSLADQLGISERTAREHVAHILLKLGVGSHVEAAVIATRWQMMRQFSVGCVTASNPATD